MDNAPAGTVYAVNERRSDLPGPRLIYRGTDTATVISGKPDGVYSYTVQTGDGKFFSNSLDVSVHHHSLATALKFFSIGAIVFAFILIAIIRGNRQRSRQL
jgi:hypothetical protein